MRALAELVITFSALFKCRFSYSENVPVVKRISRLVCIVNRKAELRL